MKAGTEKNLIKCKFRRGEIKSLIEIQFYRHIRRENLETLGTTSRCRLICFNFSRLAVAGNKSAEYSVSLQFIFKLL